MQIDVRGQNVEVSKGLVEHCVQRVSRAFRPFSSRIARVQLVFVDLNGPKGGMAQACRATVDLAAGGHVRYEGRAENFYQSISQTVANMARQVQRALVRGRSRARAVDPTSTPPPAA